MAMVLLGSWTALAAGSPVAQNAASPLRIPLVPMGYAALSQEFLLAGSTMLTVDFVDNDHLLVTFGVRRLMKREASEPGDGDDRMVGAFLVELPSGKVLAQTEWRLHDRGRYLWKLGHGRFLLRVRDRLTMIAPMHAADPNNAFDEVPLLRMGRHIVAIQVSPDEDLLTIETTKWAMGSGEVSEGFSADPAPVQISFYRLRSNGPMWNGLVMSSAGTIRTKTAVSIPITSAGRLEVLEGGKDRWLFNFDEHAGKVDELAGFDTTCFPQPAFVGHSEFVAFGCRGSSDKVDFAGFNMKGEEMWQQNFYDSHVSPTFSFAPAAGRFALGRIVVSGDFDPGLPLPASVVSAEEVRVYQTYDGKQLLRINCTPVERAGQNFALSPDGMRLGVVRETPVRHPATKYDPPYTQNEAAVEVYSLPPLAAEDQAAVKDAAAHAPEDAGARIDLALARTSPASNRAIAAAGRAMITLNGSTSTPALEPSLAEDSGGSTAAAEAEAGVGSGSVSEGDTAPNTPRKPPTLYGPDEQSGQKPH
jgi:hypothetical protein